MKIVAVTSCITGIAHTYMAAEALEQTGATMGHEITVETQGSAGSTPIKQATIDAAEFCIFATDLAVKDADRFRGKPFVHVAISKVLADPETVIKDAISAFNRGKTLTVSTDTIATAAARSSTNTSSKEAGLLKRLFGSK